MDKNKAMKLALDALLIWEEMHPKTTASAIRSPAIQALQKALEQEPWDTTDMAHRAGGLSMGQEPVGQYSDIVSDGGLDPRNQYDTAPPKREWVGLTDEEVNDLKHWLDHRAQWSYIEFARAIGAKLKEKNRG